MRHLAVFLFLLLPQLIQSQVNSFPDLWNFEATPTCGVACGSICFMAGRWKNTYSPNQEISWLVDRNGTLTSGTGPNTDHNPGTSNGHYVYTESSGSCSNSVAELISDEYDFSGLTSPSLQFWFHMYGNDMGVMLVDISFDGGSLWFEVEPPFTSNYNIWQKKIIDLSAYAGLSSVTLRITGITGNGIQSDMALDDIYVGEMMNVNCGACCLDNGTCLFISEAACTGLNGAYQGDEVTCPIPQTYYADFDGDMYSNGNTISSSCDPGSNYKLLNELLGNGSEDCNDGDPLINPDAEEVCDGIDNDCDSLVDDDDQGTTGQPYTYYLDNDGDGYGVDPPIPFCSSVPPMGYALLNDDCNDSNPDVTIIGAPCDDDNESTADDFINDECICVGGYVIPVFSDWMIIITMLINLIFGILILKGHPSRILDNSIP